MAKVYVKTDYENRIVEINSDIFLTDSSGYTLIDEGEGDKYAHAQNYYLPKGLADIFGNYHYKLIDGAVVENSVD